MSDDKKSGFRKLISIIIILGFIGLFIIYVVVPSMFVVDEKSYTGEFVKANKIYMPDGYIKLVLYFNETESLSFVIFDDWNAEHSVQLSNNIVEGDMITINYTENESFGIKELVEIILV